jgi:hypothetical protein
MDNQRHFEGPMTVRLTLCRMRQDFKQLGTRDSGLGTEPDDQMNLHFIVSLALDWRCVHLGHEDIAIGSKYFVILLL